MTAMGYVALEAIPIMGKKIAVISPVSWLFFTRIENTYFGVYLLPTRSYIFTFLGIGIVICIALILIKSRTVEYDFYKED